MHRTITIIFVLAFLCASVLWAQTPPPMPKPGPEQQRLHYFVGDWKSEGDMKPSPFGPAGKFTSTDHSQMLGDFFVVIHSDGQGPMGPTKELATMAYDPKEKVYTYDMYDSMGMHEVSKGTVAGDTWTWNTEEEIGGKPIKGRFIIKEVSPTSYTYKYDMLGEGGSWTTLMEGKSTKTK